MLCIDGHLDLAYNGLFYNRDLKKTVAEVRAWEADMGGKGRGRNTVCLPDMRRGEIGVEPSIPKPIRTTCATHLSCCSTLRSNVCRKA